MDLRTKLVFSLVAVSLVSMLALGTLAYTLADDLLVDRTLRQLTSLAEAKAEDLASVVEGWKDRVALVAGQAELARDLRAMQAGRGDASELAGDIRRSLEDALAASEVVRSLTVFDSAGVPVVAVSRFDALEARPLSRPLPRDSIIFEGVFFEEGRETFVRFLAPLFSEGDPVGALRASLNTSDLEDLDGGYAGLGDTGEAMVVTRDSLGRIRVLDPLRHPPPPGGVGLRPETGESPLEMALARREGPFTSGMVDYRGEPVWAATRFLPEVGWGLVIKFDAAEEKGAIQEFGRRLRGAGFSLSAFAILTGIFLGLHFARPIQELAEAADRIRLGELGARADVESEDELGVLASAFNEMGEELERRMTLLEEYKRFFDVSRDMLCIAGTDGYFKRINPAFERNLGWSAEELLGRPFVEFVHPDDVERTLRETEKLRRGIPTIAFENRYRLPDGGYTWLHWTCHPDTETGLLYAIARPVAGPEGAEVSESPEGEARSSA